MFDMHVHTCYSDGLYSPVKVIDLAVKRGLSGIAITDHDTVEGIEEAVLYSLNFNNFTVIPGIEFSSIYNDEEVHILGYYIDYKNSDIIYLTNILRKSRYDRTVKIIDKINQLGMNITFEEVKELSGNDNLGRPHIARALIKKGYVSNIQEAFNRYLNRGKAAYVERYQITIEESIELIKKSGGVSVLAHPGLLRNKGIINYCIEKGIDGIEAIHSKHSDTEKNIYKKIAHNNNLPITGGSDCHGEIINGDLLLGKYYIGLEELGKIKERI